MKTAPELLQAAADILVDGGWVKNYLVDPAGGHCAIGALLAAGDTNPIHKKVTPVFVEVLQILANRVDPDGALRAAHFYTDSDDWQVVARWNNTVAVSRDEVVDLFLRTARDLRLQAVVEEMENYRVEKELVSA